MTKYKIVINLSSRPTSKMQLGYFVLPPIPSKFGNWLFHKFFTVAVFDKTTLDTVTFDQDTTP